MLLLHGVYSRFRASGLIQGLIGFRALGFSGIGVHGV